MRKMLSDRRDGLGTENLISTVEVKIDNGLWQKAKLDGSKAPFTWQAWTLDWKPTSGEHTITTRATGVVQPAPDDPFIANKKNLLGERRAQRAPRADRVRRVGLGGLYDGRAPEPKGVRWRSTVKAASDFGTDSRQGSASRILHDSLKSGAASAYDILLVCSINRLGRSVLQVKLDATGSACTETERGNRRAAHPWAEP